jgi:hypothetical protein
MDVFKSHVVVETSSGTVVKDKDYDSLTKWSDGKNQRSAYSSIGEFYRVKAMKLERQNSQVVLDCLLT